jgi:hypothetical protein
VGVGEPTRAMESGPGEDKGGRADERTGGMAGEAEPGRRGVPDSDIA